MATSHTMSRLAVPAGLGITTSIWSATKENPRIASVAEPYQNAFLSSLIPVVFSVLLLITAACGTKGSDNRTPTSTGAEEHPQQYSDSETCCASEKASIVLMERQAALDGDAGVWRGVQIGLRSSTLPTVTRQSADPSGSLLSRPAADPTHISIPDPRSQDTQGPQAVTDLGACRGGQPVYAAPTAPFGDPEHYFHGQLTSEFLNPPPSASNHTSESKGRRLPLGKP